MAMKTKVLLLSISLLSMAYQSHAAENKTQCVKDISKEIRQLLTLLNHNVGNREKKAFQSNLEELKKMCASNLQEFARVLTPVVFNILEHDNCHFIQLLLESGFDPSIEIEDPSEDFLQGNLLIHALRCSNIDTILLILDKSPLDSTCCLTLRNASGAILESIVAMSLLLQRQDLGQDLSRVLEKLLEKGCRVDNPTKLCVGKGAPAHYYPVYRAIISGNLRAIKLFVKHGASLDVVLRESIGTPQEEITSALYAAISFNLDGNGIAYLVKNQPHLDQGKIGLRNGLMLHPLTFAVEENNIKTVDLLLKAGSDPDIQTITSDGLDISPRMQAYYLGYKTITRLFNEYDAKKKHHRQTPCLSSLLDLFKTFKDEDIKPVAKTKQLSSKKQQAAKKAAKALKKSQQANAKRAQEKEQEKESEEQEELVIEEGGIAHQPASRLKQGAIAFKKRITDWFCDPGRALSVQGYLETSPHPDPFKRALFETIGKEKIIADHRFPRSLDTSIMFDDAYGEVKDQGDGSYVIKVPGHLVEVTTDIIFGQFEYVFRQKEDGTRVILHRFFRRLTPAELEGNFPRDKGWGSITTVPSNLYDDDVLADQGACSAAVVDQDDAWQSEYEQEGWVFKENKQQMTTTLVFSHPKLRYQYGIKKRIK